jgi:cytochrome P450
MFRQVARPTVIGQHQLRPGDAVLARIGSANRDENVFDDPDRFDMRRTPNKHLAFGFGTHFCLGAPQARLEAGIALEAVARRWARRSNALLPRIGSSNNPSHSSTPR